MLPLIAEYAKCLEILVMKVKGHSEKVRLRLNIKHAILMTMGPAARQ